MARQAGQQSVATEDADGAATQLHAETAEPAESPQTAPDPAQAETAPQGPAPSPQPRRRASFLRRNLGRLLLAVIAVAVVAGYFVWRARPVPAHYVTEAATRGSIVKSIATTGTINPLRTVQVGSKVSGIVSEINCDYNTRVKAGQLCAKIDPRPYQLTVAQNEADLASAKAQLDKDQANLKYAQIIYERDAKLLKQQLISPDTVDSDKSKFDQAKAQIEVDKAQIQQREAALHAANVDLGYTDIVSPVDGIVISRNVDVGQTVAASFQTPTLFLIGKDLTKMQVDTNVSETDVGQAKAGQKATFTVEAYPDKTFTGTVTQVRQAPITVQNVVTYDVVIGVDNPDLLLLPGMTANTRIITDERDNVLRVPLQAIRFTPGGFHAGSTARPAQEGGAARGTAGRGGFAAERGAFAAGHGNSAASEQHGAGERARVWVLEDGKPRAVRVTTGLSDNTYVEITGGDLKAGDKVIVNETGSAAAASGRQQQRGGRPPFMRF